MNLLKNGTGSVIVTYILGTVTILVIAMVAYLIYVNTHSTLATNTTPTGSVTATKPTTYILPPATVAPKIAECQQSLSYAHNGDPSPIKCNNGALNVLAWNALAAQEPSVMKLGYQPSQTQVQTAICQDANAADLDSSARISAPLENTAYQLAALYYGWKLNINPYNVISHC